MLLHREGPSHRDGFTQRDDFTKEFFYTQVLLHRDAFNTEMLLHTGASRRKKKSTEMICQDKVLDASGFAHRCLYTEMLLHTCVFTPIRLHSYTVLLHTSSLCRGSFTRKHCYTEMHLTDSDRRAYTQMLAQGDVFFTHACSFPFFKNHTCFYIELFLQRDTFTQRCVYTGMLSHTETLLHTNTFAHIFF